MNATPGQLPDTDPRPGHPTDPAFVVPEATLPRHRYSVADPTQGPQRVVTVLENRTNDDPDAGPRLVGTYERTLAYGPPPFEPFRQYRNGVWRDYALISADYTHLSVMDLADGAIIATEQPSAETLTAAGELIATNPARYGDRAPEDLARLWGFCPVEFHVPDWWETNPRYSRRAADTPTTPTGEFGIYSGCMWGDDTAWKIQYVDLSAITDGRVTTDARFGYLEQPHPLTLDQVVQYRGGQDITFALGVDFNLTDGAATPGPLDDIIWRATS